MTAQGQISIAANALVANIISGQMVEFLPTDSYVQIALNQAVTGLIATVKADQDLILEDTGSSNLLVKTTSPIFPDDFFLEFAVSGGSRLLISARNTTAAAINLFYSIRTSNI